MNGTDPSIDFSAFALGFLYNQYSPMVQGTERWNTLSTVSNTAQLRWLQEELSIPQKLDISVIEQWDPLGWRGYFFDLHGTYETAEDLQNPRMKDAPRFWLHSHHASDGQVYTVRHPYTYEGMDFPPLIAWRRRVRYQDCGLWLEARWTPETGETLWLRGAEHEVLLTSTHPKYKDGKAINSLKTLSPKTHESIALLKAFEAAHGGRPPDFENKAAFWQFYWDSYQKVLAVQQRDGNKLPTKTQVAAEMLISVRSLKRYRDRHELPWPPQPPP
jgi:hypothetical protein